MFDELDREGKGFLTYDCLVAALKQQQPQSQAQSSSAVVKTHVLLDEVQRAQEAAGGGGGAGGEAELRQRVVERVQTWHAQAPLEVPDRISRDEFVHIAARLALRDTTSRDELLGKWFGDAGASLSVVQLTSGEAPRSAENQLKYLLYGGIAGVVSRTATAPLERLKIINQVEFETVGPRYRDGVFRSLARLAREEGLVGFWRGNGINSVRIFPTTAVRFYTYEVQKRWLLDEGYSPFPNDGMTRVAAGGMAGVIASTVTYPLDLLRSRLSGQTASDAVRYASSWDACKHIFRTEGVRGFFKGLLISLAGVGPFAAVNFASYETINKLREQHFGAGKPSPLSGMLVGGVAGGLAVMCTYPLDLLRRRMMIQGIGGEPVRYTNSFQATAAIWRQEGFMGFWRGLWPCNLKVIPASALTFWTMETCKLLFG